MNLTLIFFVNSFFHVVKKATKNPFIIVKITKYYSKKCIPQLFFLQHIDGSECVYLP
jgi:hypothetical protein